MRDRELAGEGGCARPWRQALALVTLAALMAAALAPTAGSAASPTDTAGAASPDRAASATSAPGASTPSLTWHPLGPFGGSVQVLAADGAGTVYAGTTDAGVFRSGDGATWTPARDGLPSGAVLDLAADPAAAGALVAITAGGVASSTDGGASWTASFLRGNPLRLALSAAAHQTVYAFGVPGASRAAPLHRSDDGGATWRPVPTDLPPGTVFNAFVADPQTAGVLYGSTSRGMVFRSADGGAHWTGVQADDSHTGIGPLAIDPADPRVIIAASMGSTRLLESRDGGTTWTAKFIPVGGIFVALAFDPLSPSTLVGDASLMPIGGAGPFHGLFKSGDGGTTWTELHAGPALPDLPQDEPSALLLSPFERGHYFAATLAGPGVVASQDGGTTWTAANQGLAAATVSSVTADPFAPDTLYATLDAGIARSTDCGATWADASAGLTFDPVLGPGTIHQVTADPVTPGLLYAAGDASFGPGVFKSADGGTGWTGLAAFDFTADSIAIDARHPLWLYAVGAGACDAQHGGACLPASIPRAAASRDGGATWTEMTRIEVPRIPGKDSGAFAAVRLSPIHPQTVYAVGTLSWKSGDGGRSWHRLPLPGPRVPGEVSITDLAIDPRAPRTLYAAHVGGEVLRSPDAGDSFAPAGALPPRVVPIALAVEPSGLFPGAAAGAVYAGTSAGVFRSGDGGGTWQRLGAGLDLFRVLGLTINPPATLYASTLGGGVFALDLAAAAAAVAGR